MHWLKMYGRFVTIYIKQLMEYRFSFYGDIFVNMVTFVTLYLGLWVIFNRFESLNGWSYFEVMFLYNINLLSYALCSFFLWGPMKGLEELVRKGEFDSFLIRPLPPLRLLIFRQFGHTFIGHIIVAVLAFIICIKQLNVQWFVGDYLFFISVIIGATFIHSAIIIIAGSSAFWIVKSTAIVDVTIYAIRNYINYPINIYSKWLQLILTFIIPYGFVNFYPSSVLLGKKNIELSSVYYYATPIIGFFLLVVAIYIFRRGITKYESTGS